MCKRQSDKWFQLKLISLNRVIAWGRNFNSVAAFNTIFEQSSNLSYVLARKIGKVFLKKIQIDLLQWKLMCMCSIKWNDNGQKAKLKLQSLFKKTFSFNDTFETSNLHYFVKMSKLFNCSHSCNFSSIKNH